MGHTERRKQTRRLFCQVHNLWVDDSPRHNDNLLNSIKPVTSKNYLNQNWRFEKANRSPWRVLCCAVLSCVVVVLCCVVAGVFCVVCCVLCVVCCVLCVVCCVMLCCCCCCVVVLLCCCVVVLSCCRVVVLLCCCVVVLVEGKGRGVYASNTSSCDTLKRPLRHVQR